jgi:hypothetical protein
MAEYRKNRGPVETPEACGADLDAGKMEKYYSLAGEYMLDDDMVIGGSECRPRCWCDERANQYSIGSGYRNNQTANLV